MKKIAGLVAIALRLHREGYNFRHGVFEELADRERISYNDALTVTEPLAELIDLEILDGGDGSELQNIDARLIDINRADQGFMNDPAFSGD